MKVQFLVLCIGLVGRLWGQEERKQDDFQLIVREGDWREDPRKLHGLFAQAGAILWQYFPNAEVPPVEVAHREEGPFVFFKLNQRGHKRIQLSSQGAYWSQHVYQFTHEFCHLLVGHREGNRANHWFEEAVCELAAIYVIGEMARGWEKNPAVLGTESYADAFAKYARSYEKRESYQLPEGVTFREWFAAEEPSLRKSEGVDRERNGVIALQLLPYVKKAPSCWGAFRFLNVQRAHDEVSFERYLKNWSASSPTKYRPFIKRIAWEFGLKI